MYCPNCGQQQVSDEMRFCSRCGLALSALAEWLAGGSLPVRQKEETKAPMLSPRRKGIRRAGKLMFFSGVIFPVFLVISIAAEEPGPMVIPFLLFFVSLAWMLYARLFGDNTVPAMNRPPQTTTLVAPPARTTLPPATTPHISDIGRPRTRTNELAQPPSVTEHTTKLLDHE
jgi:hypothetical protein